MFKKLISITVIAALIISCAFAELIDRRVSVFEYYELQSQRLNFVYEKYGIDLRDNVFSPAVFSYLDNYEIIGVYGNITVDKSDLKINSLLTTLIDADAEEDEGHNVVLKAIIAISALEMNERQADVIESMHEFDESYPADVLMKYLDEYDSKIHPKLDTEKLQAGEEILVYQGNYDYYAGYMNLPELGGQIYLIAKAR